MTFMPFVINYYSKVKLWLGFEIHNFDKWRKNCKIACGIEVVSCEGYTVVCNATYKQQPWQGN